jgi:hypothetical protein
MFFLTTDIKKTVRGLLYMPIQLVRYELKEFVLFIDETDIVYDVHIFEYRMTKDSDGEQKEVGQTYIGYVEDKKLYDLPYDKQEEIKSGTFEWTTPIDFSTVKNIEAFLDGDSSKLMSVPGSLDEFM